MNDLEKLERLLTEWGVGFEKSKSGNPSTSHFDSIAINSNRNKVGGYNSMLTEFVFDDKCEFVEVNLWEV